MRLYLELKHIAGIALLSLLVGGGKTLAATTLTANSARDMQSVAGTAAASDSEPGLPVPPPSADGQEPGVSAPPPSADGQEPAVPVPPPSADGQEPGLPVPPPSARAGELEPGLPTQTQSNATTKAVSSGAESQDTVLVNDVGGTSGVDSQTVTDTYWKPKEARKKGASKNKQ